MTSFNIFWAKQTLRYWNQVGGDWKRVSCHGNRTFYSYRCVSCRTISLPSFNGLCCKLARIALFLYLIYYWVECLTSSVISFAYFTHFQTSMSRDLMQIFTKSKQRFYPLIEFYVTDLKNQGVKIWSLYHFKVSILTGFFWTVTTIVLMSLYISTY